MIKAKQVSKLAVGLWRSCIALVLVVVTSPFCWLIDYNELAQFVKRYGIDLMALLSIFLGAWMYIDTHPVRGLLFPLFCIWMSILQKPEVYFGKITRPGGNG